MDLDNVDYHEIARRGDVEVMDVFLTAGLDVNLTNTRGHSLLMIASYNHQPGMARLLLAHGADPNQPDASGSTPLMGTVFKGDIELAALLLEAG
ncbi:MAG: ankyrin repeat domain-containing protein, partial [Pseudomonadota bacterium]|nr:ankyrin repeat domain-containing protein [Pseudomonadota bacterium]